MMETILDSLLETDISYVLEKIKKFKNYNLSLYEDIDNEARIFLNENPWQTNINKLVILQSVCQCQYSIDPQYFKTSSIFQLVAVTKGYLSSNFHEKRYIKGYFARGLKKTDEFWQTDIIVNISNSIKQNSTQAMHKIADIESRKYLWQFISYNFDIFPATFDIFQFAIKSMLMIRTENKSYKQIFEIINSIVMKSEFWFQALVKNAPFLLTFLFPETNERFQGLTPYLSLMQISKTLSYTQLYYIVSKSMAQPLTETQICGCVGSVFKMGLSVWGSRLLKVLIKAFRNAKRYYALVKAYEKNVRKIFVFLKFEYFYPYALNILKYFILGPWPISSLYNIFSEKIQYFSKVKSLEQLPDLLLLIKCVIKKYKYITLVEDLENLIQIINQNNQSIENIYLYQKKIVEIINEFDWKIFTSSSSTTKIYAEENSIQIKGIVNIGNSCYMNSFLQSLFMNVDLRSKILSINVYYAYRNLLERLKKRFEGCNNVNLVKMTKEQLRPFGELQNFFALLYKSKRPSISPSNIRKVCPPEFQNNFQHDSIELGRFLLEFISFCIDPLFYGEIYSQIICPFCSVSRSRKYTFLDFMLSSTEPTHPQGQIYGKIYEEQKETQEQTQGEQVKEQEKQKQKEDNDNTDDKIRIYDMVQFSMKDYELEGLQCDNCNNKSSYMVDYKYQKVATSIKRNRIVKYPNYLILTLKRFEYDIKNNKNTKKSFKLHLQEYFKFQYKYYKLISFIVHRGVSANSGHYYTFSVQNFSNGAHWVCLNDTVVTKFYTLDSVCIYLDNNPEDTPYILFGGYREYMESNKNQMEISLKLSPRLQTYVENDNMYYVKSLSQKQTILDLSSLKIPNAQYWKKDHDDNQGDQGFGGNGNPIM